MKSQSIRDFWFDKLAQLTLESNAYKQSMHAPFGLMEIYDQFDEYEKTEIHQILKEWLLSDDSDYRWLAKFLIRQRHLIMFVPNLEKVIQYLKNLPQTVHIKYEIKDIENLINELQGVSSN